MKNTAQSKASLVGLFGVGGCGRSAMPIVARAAAKLYQVDGNSVVFVDDSVSNKTVNGRQVVSYKEFVAARSETKRICIAVADSRVRENLANRCKNDGLEFFSVVAGNAEILDNVEIGEGALILPFATIGSNTRIGKHFHGNLYSYIEHDCEVGDFVTLAPGAKCNGNVSIGSHAYLGAGCVIRQGRKDRPLKIGESAVIGMGAVVTKDVPAGVTVVGNPARLISETVKC